MMASLPYKVVFIGDSGTGKTLLCRALVRHWRGDAGQEQIVEHRETIGVDFMTVSVACGSNDYMRMQLWDVAGRRQYTPLLTALSRNAALLIMVYDASRPEPTWRSLVDTWSNVRGMCDECIETIVVGTHCDRLGTPLPLLDVERATAVSEWRSRSVLLTSVLMPETIGQLAEEIVCALSERQDVCSVEEKQQKPNEPPQPASNRCKVH